MFFEQIFILKIINMLYTIINILYTIISGYHNYIMFEIAIHIRNVVPLKSFVQKVIENPCIYLEADEIK